MAGEDEVQAVGEAFTASIKFARGAERLRAAGVALHAVGDALRDLAEFEPELAPELATSMEHVGEATEALLRGVNFLDARLDAALRSLLDAA